MNITPKAKRILCYGDSNTWGWVPMGMGLKRFTTEERWTGILQKKLGENYEIIEEGLGGRTTMFDDPRPEFPERNGLKSLPAILESHLPLDLVILMLGTTDTKEMLSVSQKDITEGMRRLVKAIKEFKVLEGSQSPEILVIVPPIVEEEAELASKLFKGGKEKTASLVQSYAKLAEAEGVNYLDPTREIKVDTTEGIHLDANNHSKLAELVFEKIKNLEL